MMRTRFDARARDIGLTRAQWRMIATIHLSKGATQSEIASKLEINSVTVGRIVDRLEGAGSVERRASAVDRRRTGCISPTPLLTVLGGLGDEEENTSLQGFSEQARETFARLLVRVTENLLQAPPISAGTNAAARPTVDELD